MLYYKRNRPVVGLLQLPEGYPISFRFPSSYLRYGGGIFMLNDRKSLLLSFKNTNFQDQAVFKSKKIHFFRLSTN